MDTARAWPAVTSHRRGASAVVAALLISSLMPAGAAAPAPPASALRRVVVTTVGSLDDAADAVRRLGGRVTALLPLIGGLAAELPSNAPVAPGITVVDDRPVGVTGGATPASAPANTLRASIGLTAPSPDGAGVTVAVVDTGVAEVGDLAGRVVGHINTSDGLAGDGYGHGTFMAGLIAGSGAASAGRFAGVAAGAQILDVQVADADGSTSLSNVLRGLEAVAADSSVSVVNLSLSAPTHLPWHVDPLTRALDALWDRGVTVVVPAGNDGPSSRSVTSPGTDPNLLTVGAVDEGGTAERADDSTPAWTSRGPAPMNVAKPDLAAPGASVVSLRAAGSAVDTASPHARVESAYFRGSGTSMASAVTAGAAAVLLSARPHLSPDDVKNLFRGTAYAARGLRDAEAAGYGGLDAGAALAAAVPSHRGAPRPPAVGTLPAADVAAFEDYISAVLDGDKVAAARSWATLSPAARSWAARSWAARSWTGPHGAGTDWSARSWADWAARSWTARSWVARSWADDSWSARSWSDLTWESAAWADMEWAARSWVVADWSARSWSARSWSARSWSARSWSARSWG